jgi:hypothetical protein
MSTQVYWIRAAHHSDITSEGYVGVSKNASKRWAYGHKWAHAKGRHDNPRLSNAIAKHGWDSLIKTVVVVADEAYCYELENKLRPAGEIGWNLAAGGCKPPVSKSRGPDYVSPLKGVPRPTPWLIGKSFPMPENFGSLGGKAGKGRKQNPEQIAKRVASRRATLEAQGRTV